MVSSFVLSSTKLTDRIIRKRTPLPIALCSQPILR
jgi:hypothetical protein